MPLRISRTGIAIAGALIFVPTTECIMLPSFALQASGGASAQSNTARDQALDPALAPSASELDELNELDALSRTNENPFGEIVVQKQRVPVSVTLRALDKIVARTVDLDVAMNSVATFGSLEIVPRTCDKRPPEDFPETTTFLEIFDSRPARTDGRKPRALSAEEREAAERSQARTQALTQPTAVSTPIR